MAQSLSLSRAAQAMFISQPALSRQIKDLEDELGVTLFKRHFNGMRLTPAGEAFFLQAREIIAKTDAAVKAVTGTRPSSMLRISIGFDPWISSAALLKTVSEFNLAFPDIVIRLHEANSSPLLHQLSSNAIDFCITLSEFPLRLPQIESTQLGNVSIAVYLDHHTYMSQREKLTEFLPLHTMLHYQPLSDIVETESPPPVDIHRLLGFRPGATLRVPSYTALIGMIASRQGYWIGPADSPMALVGSNVVCIPVPNSESQLHAFASWRSGEMSSPGQSLVEILKSCF